MAGSALFVRFPRLRTSRTTSNEIRPDANLIIGSPGSNLGAGFAPFGPSSWIDA